MSTLTEVLADRDIVVIECTIPVGMTIDEWRRWRTAQATRRRK
jgi:hypothetical protein